MPQPAFVVASSPTRITTKFGGQALPNGQGTLSYIDINDRASWFLQDYAPDSLVHQLQIGQQVFRNKGVYLSDDWGATAIVLPYRYYEGPGTVLGAALAQIAQAGEQYLTFDNLTGILVKLSAVGKNTKRKLVTKYSPYWWEFDLEFVARTPWFVDLSATTAGPTSIGGSVSPGTTTNINYTYAGSVFAEPVFTLTIPNTNTVTITSFVLKNTTSGEAMTLTFSPALSASTAYTITLDCGAWTVKDASGNNYDLSGSFPMLYGPAGQVNAYQATLVTGSGTSTGVTLSVSYNNRWMF